MAIPPFSEIRRGNNLVEESDRRNVLIVYNVGKADETIIPFSLLRNVYPEGRFLYAVNHEGHVNKIPALPDGSEFRIVE